MTLSPAASLRRRKLRTSISAPSDQRPTRLPLLTWASVAVTMIIPSMRNCARPFDIDPEDANHHPVQ